MRSREVAIVKLRDHEAANLQPRTADGFQLSSSEMLLRIISSVIPFFNRLILRKMA